MSFKLPFGINDVGAVLGFAAAVVAIVAIAKKVPGVKSLV